MAVGQGLILFISLPLQHRLFFWFATGGAGLCLSRALTQRLAPLAAGGKFFSMGQLIRRGDDVILGYFIVHRLRVKMTLVKEFHSHYENFFRLGAPENKPWEQISFSYKGSNTLRYKLPKICSDGCDPTR